MNRWLAERACSAYRRRSPFYWLLHELHMLLYWRGRNDLRWRLHEQRQERDG